MRVNPETGAQFATMMVQDEGEPLAELNLVSTRILGLNHTNTGASMMMTTTPSFD